MTSDSVTSDSVDEPVTDPDTARQQRFARLPDAIGPGDWVLSRDPEAAPWSIYTAPDVAEEQARRWGFVG